MQLYAVNVIILRRSTFDVASLAMNKFEMLFDVYS